MKPGRLINPVCNFGGFGIAKSKLKNENHKDQEKLVISPYVNTKQAAKGITSLAIAMSLAGNPMVKACVPNFKGLGSTLEKPSLEKTRQVSTIQDKNPSNQEEKKWWKEAVVYQVYPRSFKDTDGDGIGDLKGITQKLDYLEDLGVNVVWLNPVYKSPNDDNGYDISDYQDIMTEFGTMKDWEKLADGLHSRGMKLIMDLVVNHTSDEHKWFQESKSSKDNPYRDYYIWKPPAKDGGPPNDLKSMFGGSAWEYDPKTGEYYLHMFSKKQPDLNWENPKVREDIYKMMQWWLDKGIDGFRMDVINMISKNDDIFKYKRGESHDYKVFNGPRLHEYLKEMNSKVLSKYDAMTVGEWPGGNIDEALKAVGKDNNELNMVIASEHLMSGFMNLKNTLTKWQDDLEGKGWNCLFLSNHDQPRALSRFGSDKGKNRELTAKLLATMTMTLKGTPYIYMGEEIGMTNCNFNKIQDYKDIETLNNYKVAKAKGMSEQEAMDMVKKTSRDNARTPMQWDNSGNAGFSNGNPWLKVNSNFSLINVEKDLKDPNSIFKYYQNMIKLRKDNPVLIYGKFHALINNDKRIYAYTRTLGKNKVLVVLNFSDKDASFPAVQNKISLKNAEQLIGNYPPDKNQNQASIQLRPYEARVYKLN